MVLKNNKIFLAGSTGMAGSSVLRYFIDNYPDVKINASYHITLPFFKDERINYSRGDLTSLDDSRRMSRGCDCAIMAAAYAGGIAFSQTHPWEHMKENLMMNMQMLEAFRLEKIKRIIFIGSATLYQEFSGNIKEEELDLSKEPSVTYFGFAWAMRFLEKLCWFLHKEYGLEIIIVRLGNIFGPYARFDPQFSNFIPAIIRKAIERMDPFEVWGSPDVARDVLYVDDFARAIAMMVEQSKIKFETFNLGSGIRTTVGNVVEWALKYAQHKPTQIRYIENAPSAVSLRALDCSKVKKILGWQPHYTIEEGIKKTVEWWMQNNKHWKK